MNGGKIASDLPTTNRIKSLGSSDFVLEVGNIIKPLGWQNWFQMNGGHSILVTLWKGSSKEKADDPKSYINLNNQTFENVLWKAVNRWTTGV